MNENELKASLLQMLERIDRNVSSAHPETMTGLTLGQELVLGLLAGCRRLFRGIYVLLSESMAEESRIFNISHQDGSHKTILLEKTWFMPAGWI